MSLRRLIIGSIILLVKHLGLILSHRGGDGGMEGWDRDRDEEDGRVNEVGGRRDERGRWIREEDGGDGGLKRKGRGRDKG